MKQSWSHYRSLSLIPLLWAELGRARVGLASTVDTETQMWVLHP